MNFYQIPMGFGMALSMNPMALNVYSAMTEEQKQAILREAGNAKSQEEMHRIINRLIK